MRRWEEIVTVAIFDAVIAVLFLPSFFGTPGGFTTTAIISAGAITCDSASITCTVDLQNTGTADVKAVGCYLTYNSSPALGVVGGAATINIPAGGAGANATCTLSSPSSGVSLIGSQATGQFVLNNGGEVMFEGVWA